jgi:hypothetical protein
VDIAGRVTTPLANCRDCHHCQKSLETDFVPAETHFEQHVSIFKPMAIVDSGKLPCAAKNCFAGPRIFPPVLGFTCNPESSLRQAYREEASVSLP